MDQPKRRGLKYLRGTASQRDTAAALGINYKTYNHFEHRRRRPRDLDTLLKMAEHFEVSVEEIIWHLGDDARPSSHASKTA